MPPLPPAAPIEVFNRYTGRVESEPVYGEKWLRWTYETVPGRMTLALAVKRHWFSRLYGRRMRQPRSRRLIKPFIAGYGVDPDEFQDPPESFGSFNEFFTRRLKPVSRPICADPDAIVFPADGRHLGHANVSAAAEFYAKNQRLDVPALLGDQELARRFAGGAVVISRLCPLDYHRFHFPCAGRATEARLIKGPLLSVNPIALRRTLRALVENKRMVTLMESKHCGAVAIVEIGATCVGTIVQTFRPGEVRRGEEKGYFAFGGSCVITLFEPGRVRLAHDLLEQTRAGRELFARMGDQLARLPPNARSESEAKRD